MSIFAHRRAVAIAVILRLADDRAARVVDDGHVMLGAFDPAAMAIVHDIARTLVSGGDHAAVIVNGGVGAILDEIRTRIVLGHDASGFIGDRHARAFVGQIERQVGTVGDFAAIGEGDGSVGAAPDDRRVIVGVENFVRSRNIAVCAGQRNGCRIGRRHDFFPKLISPEGHAMGCCSAPKAVDAHQRR
jgi:hypothetical protein